MGMPNLLLEPGRAGNVAIVVEERGRIGAPVLYREAARRSGVFRCVQECSIR